jgi:hypothetical protein
MKDYKIKIQEKDNFCLCSVLQAIFRKYEIYFSQEEIAKNLTPLGNGFLPGDDKIKEFLRNKFNYEFYLHDETPFNEPDMLLKEMNQYHGIVGINHHVYLLEEFKDPILQMIDPKAIKIIEKNILLVRREMEEKDGFFGLLKYICSS